MKALIIENDYELTRRTNQFLKHNKHLFTDIKAEMMCSNKPYAMIFPAIQWADAIIIDSQFYNKQQLQAFTHEFAAGRLKDKVYRFFIFDIKNFCNDWIKEGKDGSPYWKTFVNPDFPENSFPDYDLFHQDLIQLVDRCCVYNIMPKPRGKDHLFKCSPFPIGYDLSTNSFNFLEKDIPAACQLS